MSDTLQVLHGRWRSLINVEGLVFRSEEDELLLLSKLDKAWKESAGLTPEERGKRLGVFVEEYRKKFEASSEGIVNRILSDVQRIEDGDYEVGMPDWAVHICISYRVKPNWEFAKNAVVEALAYWFAAKEGVLLIGGKGSPFRQNVERAVKLLGL